MNPPKDHLVSDIPPHSLEAERAVLGAILLETESLPKAIGVLKASDFYKDGHRRIFAAMVTLFERREPVDLVILRDELRRRGELEEAGGEEALAQLVDEGSTAAHLHAYINIVKEHAVRRELIRISTNTIDQSYEVQEPANTLLQRTVAHLANLGLVTPNGHKAAPKAVDVVELLNKEFPDQTSWVNGCIEQENLGLIGGPPKLGKTALALGIGLKVITGEPWLGYPTTRGRVLMLQSEIPERQFQARLRLMVQDLGSALEPGWLTIVTDRAVRVDTSEGQRRIRQLIEQHHPDLVVFDPLAKFMTGDENRTQDMNVVVSFFDSLIQEFKVAILVVHHTAKPSAGDQREGGQRLRGSSVLFAAADSVLMLDRQRGRFTLSFQFRHAPEPEPMTLRRTDRLWFEASGPPQELLDVAALVRETSLRWGQLVQAIQADQEASKRTAERLLDRAKKAGLIALDADGLYLATATYRQSRSGGEGNSDD